AYNDAECSKGRRPYTVKGFARHDSPDLTRVVIAESEKGQINVLTFSRDARVEDVLDTDHAKPREIKVNGRTMFESGDEGCYLDGHRVVAGNRDLLRDILSRDDDPRLTESMRKALDEADFSLPLVNLESKHGSDDSSDGLDPTGKGKVLAVIMENDLKLP